MTATETSTLELNVELEKALSLEEATGRLMAAKGRASATGSDAKRTVDLANLDKLMNHAYGLIGEEAPARGIFLLSMLGIELCFVTTRSAKHLLEERPDLCGGFKAHEVVEMIQRLAEKMAAPARTEDVMALMSYVAPRLDEFFREIEEIAKEADAEAAPETEVTLPLLAKALRAGDVVRVVGPSEAVALLLMHWCRSLSRRHVGYNRLAMSALAVADPMCGAAAANAWWGRPAEDLKRLLAGLPKCLPLIVDDSAGLRMKAHQLARETGRAVIVGCRTDALFSERRFGKMDAVVRVAVAAGDNAKANGVLVEGKRMWQSADGDVATE